MKKYIAKLLVMLMFMSSVIILGPSRDMSNVVLADTISSGSGLSVTEKNGVKTVLAYDDFNDRSIDTNVWNSTDDFNEYSNRLNGYYGKTKIRLKGDYSDYDSYRISVDLVNLNRQYYELHNGGIGISGGNKIWSFSEVMNYSGSNGYYKALSILEYGSIKESNRDGNALRAQARLEESKRWKHKWSRSDIRLVIEANKNDSNSYDTTVSVYVRNTNGTWPSSPLKVLNYTFDDDELDFSKIYLIGIEPDTWWRYDDYWYADFDNFSFSATKVTELDILDATWNDHSYKLSWDAVEDASAYNIYYMNGGSKYLYTTLGANDTRALFIADDSMHSKLTYFVEAVVDSGNIFSNTVYLGGQINDSFTLDGTFNNDDYDLTWSSLDIEDSPSHNYTLMYGDKKLAINNIVEGAQNLSESQLSYKLKNIQNSDLYYGKYLQVKSTVNFGGFGTVDYFSNVIQVKNDVKLNLTHANSYYIFHWDVEPVYTSYNLYNSSVRSDLEDINNLPINPKGFKIEDAVNNRIYFKVLDSDSAYNNKYVLLEGKYRGDVDYATILKTDSVMTTPTLLWRKGDSGKRKFSWTPMVGAEKVELYYGATANNINTPIGSEIDFRTTHEYETIENSFDDIYAQVRFFKNDIWYYSNIVKTSNLELTTSKIEMSVSSDEKKQHNLVLKWSPVTWAEDKPPAGPVSSYRIYYLDDSGKEVTIQANMSDNNYTVYDLYETNKHLLGKEIYIESVCPTKDEFNIAYSLAVRSSAITPRKIDFSSLNGAYNDEGKYELKWSVPQEIDTTVQNLTVEAYELKYGDSKLSIINKIDVNESDLAAFLVKLDIDKEGKVAGDATNYYHKFFEVSAIIDNLTYISNNQYAGDEIILDVYRFSDDFTFNWKRLENADQIKMYFAKPNGDSEPSDEDYELYKPASLAGTAIKHTIEDLDDTKDGYNNRYFKVEAVYGDDAYDSNAVLIDVRKKLPTLEGRYQAGDAYEFNWRKVDWPIDHYQLFYDDISTEDDVSIVKYVKTDYIFDKGDDSAKISNVSTKEYYDKYVRIVAVDGHLFAFSNPEFVKEATIEGKLEDQFAADDVNIKVGNRSDIKYKFSALKEMKLPYIKIELNGSPYLSFNKISATLEKISNSKTETMPLRLVMEVDELNGVTTLYAHIDEENSVFLADGSTEYRLTVTSAIVVNDRKSKEVYEALKAYDDTLKNWALPYYIDEILINNQALDKDVFIRYKAFWNVDDTESIDDDRQTSIELFNIDLDVKNKNRLPGSM